MNNMSIWNCADAKPVAETPSLMKLQATQGGKSRITMRVDNVTLAVFKARAEMQSVNYQTLINEALHRLRRFSATLVD